MNKDRPTTARACSVKCTTMQDARLKKGYEAISRMPYSSSQAIWLQTRVQGYAISARLAAAVYIPYNSLQRLGIITVNEQE